MESALLVNSSRVETAMSTGKPIIAVFMVEFATSADPTSFILYYSTYFKILRMTFLKIVLLALLLKGGLNTKLT